MLAMLIADNFGMAVVFQISENIFAELKGFACTGRFIFVAKNLDSFYVLLVVIAIPCTFNLINDLSKELVLTFVSDFLLYECLLVRWFFMKPLQAQVC